MPSAPAPERPPAGPLVLVVEDEFLLALELELLLGQHGYRVLGPASTVAEALRARGVPFVLASAYDRAQLAAEVLAGAPNVGKPVNVRRLLAALAQAVRP